MSWPNSPTCNYKIMLFNQPLSCLSTGRNIKKLLQGTSKILTSLLPDLEQPLSVFCNTSTGFVSENSKFLEVTEAYKSIPWSKQYCAKQFELRSKVFPFRISSLIRKDVNVVLRMKIKDQPDNEGCSGTNVIPVTKRIWWNRRNSELGLLRGCHTNGFECGHCTNVRSHKSWV